jgi:hypothetical protein
VIGSRGRNVVKRKSTTRKALLGGNIDIIVAQQLCKSTNKINNGTIHLQRVVIDKYIGSYVDR